MSNHRNPKKPSHQRLLMFLAALPFVAIACSGTDDAGIDADVPAQAELQSVVAEEPLGPEAEPPSDDVAVPGNVR